ncbi:MAG: hypothetical protein Q7S26_00185 [bacterium]|nr:hypothetical protein [bacterium]
MAEKVTLESLGAKIDSMGVALESLTATTARGFTKSRKETSEAIDSLARMTARGFEESRKENLEEIGKLEEKMDRGFASIDKRLEVHYQSQFNSHAIRIKNLETFTGVEVSK